MKIVVSCPERRFEAEIPDGAHWQEALEVFLDGLRAMTYYPPTLEELGGEEVIEALSGRVEDLQGAIEIALAYDLPLGAAAPLRATLK